MPSPQELIEQVRSAPAWSRTYYGPQPKGFALDRTPQHCADELEHTLLQLKAAKEELAQTREKLSYYRQIVARAKTIKTYFDWVGDVQNTRPGHESIDASVLKRYKARLTDDLLNVLTQKSTNPENSTLLEPTTRVRTKTPVGMPANITGRVRGIFSVDGIDYGYVVESETSPRTIVMMSSDELEEIPTDPL